MQSSAALTFPPGWQNTANLAGKMFYSILRGLPCKSGYGICSCHAELSVVVQCGA